MRGASIMYRILYVDIFPLVLELLQASEEPLEILIGDRVVLRLCYVDRGLGDLGAFDVFAGFVIRRDALAIGAAGNVSTGGDGSRESGRWIR